MSRIGRAPIPVPSGVDVSGGIEREGHAPHKDPQKMLEFVRNARLAWQEKSQ